MTQIMYTYPAMIAQAGEMNGYAATLQVVGSDIAAEQASLSSAWQGDTGTSYQAWQSRWNQSMEELVTAYRAMASAHEQNTLSMNARDSAEGAKWA